MKASSLFTANDFRPDGKPLLITSNAGNGYENVGLLDIATKKIDWLTQDKWEISGGNFSPDGKIGDLDRQRGRQHRHLSARSRIR